MVAQAGLTAWARVGMVHVPASPGLPGPALGYGPIMKAAAIRSYLWLFWTLAIAGVVLDQASKYGIFAWLYSDGTP